MSVIGFKNSGQSFLPDNGERVPGGEGGELPNYVLAQNDCVRVVPAISMKMEVFGFIRLKRPVPEYAYDNWTSNGT